MVQNWRLKWIVEPAWHGADWRRGSPAKWRERQLKCRCHIWLLAFEGVSALRRVVQCSAGAIDRCKKLRWRGSGHFRSGAVSATIPQTGESMTQFPEMQIGQFRELFSWPDAVVENSARWLGHLGRASRSRCESRASCRDQPNEMPLSLCCSMIGFIDGRRSFSFLASRRHPE